jgi:hypothetical protein
VGLIALGSVAVADIESKNQGRIGQGTLDNQRNTGEGRESNNESYIEKISAGINRVEQELSRANDENTPHKKWDRRWARAGVLGLWAAALVGLLAIFVATHDAWRQRDAMDQQLAIMQAQQRAWIAVEPPQTIGPLEFDDSDHRNGSLTATFVLKNVGHEPAVDVSFYWYITDALMRHDLFEQRQRQAGGGVSLGNALIIFPDEAVPKPARYRFTESEWPNRSPGSAGGVEYVVLAIAGMAKYKFVGTSEIHETAFAYYVIDPRTAADPSPWVRANPMLFRRDATHIDTMILSRYGIAGNWAN